MTSRKSEYSTRILLTSSTILRHKSTIFCSIRVMRCPKMSAEGAEFTRSIGVELISALCRCQILVEDGEITIDIFNYLRSSELYCSVFRDTYVSLIVDQTF